MHLALCQCHAVPQLDLTTRVELVLHHREQGKPTATGELALACLTNSAVHVHGLEDDRLDLRGLHARGRRVVILYPAPDARVLDATFLAEDPRPVTLVVPDGSWRQASKMARRIPGLARARPVGLPPGPPSRYRLRREVKPQGLATMEAIARALGVLEGPAVQRTIEALFDRVVDATLWTRQQTGTRYEPDTPTR